MLAVSTSAVVCFVVIGVAAVYWSYRFLTRKKRKK